MIENRGSANLEIRAVEKESGININIQKGDVIRPGEKIKIRAESTKKTFNVFLITNDPARPFKEIRFNYEDK
jgi:transcription elongation GreA/GreB family factor